MKSLINRNSQQNEADKKKHWNSIRIGAVVILIIIAVWVYRLSSSYVIMYTSLPVGIENIMAANDTRAYSEEAMPNLESLQDKYDLWRNSILLRKVEVSGFERISLSGWMHENESDTTVIYLLPLGEDSDSDAILAPFYSSLGYNILIPDSRHHGNSGGDIVTYGLKESEDLLYWIEFILSKYGKNHKLILHGEYLGAVTILSAIDNGDLPGNVIMAVLDSPFSSLKSAAAYQLRHGMGLPAFPFLQICDLLLGSRHGFRMDDVDLSMKIEEAALPALFIHGATDAYISPVESQKLFTQYGGPKEILVVPNAGFRSSYILGQNEYEYHIKKLIKTDHPESRF